MSGIFEVSWDCMCRSREFRTFAAAERFARNLVRTGQGKPRETEILSGHRIVATIDKDALDRIWTDMRGSVA